MSETSCLPYCRSADYTVKPSRRTANADYTLSRRTATAIRDCDGGTRISIIGALDSTELFFHPIIPQNLPLVDGSHLVGVLTTWKEDGRRRLKTLMARRISDEIMRFIESDVHTENNSPEALVGFDLRG